MRSETEIRQSLRDWLTKKAASDNRRAALEPLTDQTRIIDARVISSLKIMELVVYVEELRGEPIDISSVNADAFATIDAIYERFFSGDPPPL